MRHISAMTILTLLLTGCAAKVKSKAQLTIPRNCITDVKLTDDTKCVYSEKEKVWKCSPLVLDKVKGCEQLQVAPKASK